VTVMQENGGTVSIDSGLSISLAHPENAKNRSRTTPNSRFMGIPPKNMYRYHSTTHKIPQPVTEYSIDSGGKLD
jgi:hypothetical protein